MVIKENATEIFCCELLSGEWREGQTPECNNIFFKFIFNTRPFIKNGLRNIFFIKLSGNMGVDVYN